MSTKISYAQHGEDVVIARALRGINGVRYCDVGAAHPVVDSISRALFQLGWRGIHVEPVPTYARLLREQRPGDVVVESAVGAEDGTIDFFQVPGSGLSTASEEEAAIARSRGFEVHLTTVPVRRLGDILAEVLGDAELHLLKIDVEGAEEAALEGADLHRFRPWIVVVEATRPGSTETTHDRWEHLLTSQGYVFTMFDGLNRWYRSADHPELEAALSYPACPLDGWQRAGMPLPERVAGNGPEQQSSALLQVSASLSAQRTAEVTAQRSANDNKKLTAEVTSLRAKVKSLETAATTHAATERELATTKRQLATTQRQLDAMRQSQWWRITAPGRAVTRLLRRPFRR